jgi:hypothetical protein
VAFLVFLPRPARARIIPSDFVSSAALGCLLGGSVASGGAGLFEFALFLALELGFDLDGMPHK